MWYERNKNKRYLLDFGPEQTFWIVKLFSEMGKTEGEGVGVEWNWVGVLFEHVGLRCTLNSQVELDLDQDEIILRGKFWALGAVEFQSQIEEKESAKTWS